MPLYEVIRGNIHKLYDGMELTGATLFRLTRDAEPELEEDPDDEYSEQVKERIRLRRYEPVVRLEFGPGSNPEIRAILCDRFGLQPFDVYDLPEEVDYTSLFELLSLPGAALARRSLGSGNSARADRSASRFLRSDSRGGYAA